MLVTEQVSKKIVYFRTLKPGSLLGFFLSRSRTQGGSHELQWKTQNKSCFCIKFGNNL